MKKKQLKSNENKIYLNMLFRIFIFFYIFFIRHSSFLLSLYLRFWGLYLCWRNIDVTLIIMHVTLINIDVSYDVSSSRLYNKAVDQRTMNKLALMSTNHFFVVYERVRMLSRVSERQREREETGVCLHAFIINSCLVRRQSEIHRKYQIKYLNAHSPYIHAQLHE